jgi:hypothetical protein
MDGRQESIKEIKMENKKKISEKEKGNKIKCVCPN